VIVSPTPAERFRIVLLWLTRAVDGHSLVGRLARPLAVLIIGRLIDIQQRFTRIAERVGAGTYSPRRSGPRRPPMEKKPRRPNPLPSRPAWLLSLVPEVPALASQLNLLLADPEMTALLAAAPGAMRRPLRSLCRMLGVDPPPVLALPPRPRRPPKAPAPPRPSRPPTERPAPSARVRYVFGLRYPPPLPDPA
jgi:hypothetical protein